MSISKTENIEFNEMFQMAIDRMENTSRHVFITGKAGTGKSTLLDYFRNYTKKKLVVLAPTGVSALNVRGQTIHSFFRFKPNVTLKSIKKFKGRGKNIYKELDAVIIDETSMVRADLLDCIDRFLRLNTGKKKPFGGVQMIFIGDLYQLPPVVTGSEKEFFNTHYKSPFFFDAMATKDLEMEFIELEKIYRQKDEDFIATLNAIRNNSVTDEQLSILNRQCNPEFVPDPKDFYIWLTSLNSAAEKINREHLSRIVSSLITYHGSIHGDFKQDSLPTQVDLQVKKGAQVMLLNNDPFSRWVNGSIGKIVDIVKQKGEDDVIIVELVTGEVVDVLPYRWELFNYYFDKSKNSIESEVIGSFTQYPLKLAWAVTIHKSQGKTFDRVVIDIGRGTFASGQVYVGLSRCTRLDGIVLKKPLEKKHIFMDWRVVKFMTQFQYKLSENHCPVEEKLNLIKDAIKTNQRIEILYLKNNDVKSRRVISPVFVGEMQYSGKTYLGMEAFCHLRNDRRVFRLDRILEIREV
ncbi:MAG: AAA family ATPase [Nitrospirae bacterium]|nr:AAA family ATPase [Nitrospirota bacterium]